MLREVRGRAHSEPGTAHGREAVLEILQAAVQLGLAVGRLGEVAVVRVPRLIPFEEGHVMAARGELADERARDPRDLGGDAELAAGTTDGERYRDVPLLVVFRIFSRYVLPPDDLFRCQVQFLLTLGPDTDPSPCFELLPSNLTSMSEWVHYCHAFSHQLFRHAW